MKAESTNADDPEMVALAVLAWVLQDERRAERLLAVTGLTPDGLRAGIGDRAVLAAVMGFLMGHEPDLIACADAMGMKPEALVQVALGLE
jgi:hypothetical protein